jgi:hypothetical protein
MPAAAPDTAPRPRLASWLLAGAVVAAAAALLAGAGWFLAPRWFPELVVRRSPWADPVVRAAVIIELRNVSIGRSNTGALALLRWAHGGPARSAALTAYVFSADPTARRLALQIYLSPNGVADPRSESVTFLHFNSW